MRCFGEWDEGLSVHGLWRCRHLSVSQELKGSSWSWQEFIHIGNISTGGNWRCNILGMTLGIIIIGRYIALHFRQLGYIYHTAYISNECFPNQDNTSNELSTLSS